MTLATFNYGIIHGYSWTVPGRLDISDWDIGAESFRFIRTAISRTSLPSVCLKISRRKAIESCRARISLMNRR